VTPASRFGAVLAHPATDSPDEPNSKAYGLKYDNRSEILITPAPRPVRESARQRKLQRLKDLTVQGRPAS